MVVLVTKCISQSNEDCRNLLVSNSAIFLSLSQVSISWFIALRMFRDGANFIVISLHRAVHDQ